LSQSAALTNFHWQESNGKRSLCRHDISWWLCVSLHAWVVQHRKLSMFEILFASGTQKESQPQILSPTPHLIFQNYCICI